jgi:hypothetical protein
MNNVSLKTVNMNNFIFCFLSLTLKCTASAAAIHSYGHEEKETGTALLDIFKEPFHSKHGRKVKKNTPYSSQ